MSLHVAVGSWSRGCVLVWFDLMFILGKFQIFDVGKIIIIQATHDHYHVYAMKVKY